MAGGERPLGGRSKFKREFGEPEPAAQRNFTDPESKIMKTHQGFQQGYNAQAVVAQGSQLMVAQQVGQNAADNVSLIEMVDQVERNTGSKPGCLLAEAGYPSEENFLALEERKIEGIVALQRESKADKEKKEKKKKKENSKTGGAASERMAKRLEQQRGKRQYARRKGMVEPAFGWVKQVLGFRQFSLRGLKKVQGEWSLVTLALNPRRMARMEAVPTAA